MALSAKIERTRDGFDGALVASGVYVKVISILGDKQSIDFTVSFLAGDKKLDEQRYSFTPNLDGPNFIKQAYEHLKTLPEFAGAADV